MVYEMDRVIGSRLNTGNGGTKVSQIANIFQNNLVSSDHHHSGLDGKKLSTSSSLLVNKPPAEIADSIPIKSDGHVNRFNNARALFEKLGTSDEKLLSTSTPPPALPRYPVSKFKSSDSLNSFPSTTTTPTTTMAALSERKPTPFVLNKSNTGSNGHSNLSAKEISVSTPVNTADGQESTDCTDSPVQTEASGIRRTLFGSSVSVKEAAKHYTEMKPTDKPPTASKPASLANKFNGRELIEKQKNWISHFATPPPKKPGSPEKSSKGFAVQPKQLEVDATISPKASPLSSPSKGNGSEVIDTWNTHVILTPNTASDELDESISSSDYNGSTTTTTSQNTIVEVPIPEPCVHAKLNGNGSLNGEQGLVRGGSSASILDDESFFDDSVSLTSVSAPAAGVDYGTEECRGSEEIEVTKEMAERLDSLETTSVTGNDPKLNERITSSMELEDMPNVSLRSENSAGLEEKALVNGSHYDTTTELIEAISERLFLLSNGCRSEISSCVQIVSERLKSDQDDTKRATECDSTAFAHQELKDSLEEDNDIQKKRLPDVPKEESSVGESQLLDETDKDMVTTTCHETTSLFAEFSESDQVSPSTFLQESGKEVYYEDGIHYFEDGHYWTETPGIPGSDEDEDYFDQNIIKKQPRRIRFSTDPIKMYTTHSVDDYDRRNEDVDPAAAAAEYELEKRVEKMDVFPVQLVKGIEGLGLSIIGMGVGADAGLEKLGIFVKTITDSGAAAKDGKIQVNDQIIEVDGKSLVGVTQAYAASVLRNTSGLVNFMIGREKDTENSEVAQLIRQSLQADKEREERRKMQSQTLEFNYSPRGPPPPPPPFEESLRHLAAGSSEANLSEKLKVAHSKALAAEKEVELLKIRLTELESNVVEKESYEAKIKEMNEKVVEFEDIMKNAQLEVSTYQSMLQESQGQYSDLEKKYQRVKQIVRTLQHRERDLTHRQEFQMQRIHQRDTEYHDLLKSLKERVIQLEHELIETQRHAGLSVTHATHFPATLPTPLTLSLPPPLPPIHLELSDEDGGSELSDFEITVEKKNSSASIKEEFDSAVPQHSLLDISAVKARAGLVARGGLAGRQAPSSSAVKRPNSQASNNSLDYEGAISPEMLRDDTRSHLSASAFSFSPPVSPAKSNASAVSESQVFLSSSPSSFNSSFISAASPVSTSQLSKTSMASITSTGTKDNSHVESPFSYFSASSNQSSYNQTTTTTTSTLHSSELMVQQKRGLTELEQIPPPAKYAQAEVTAGVPVHIINRSYSPDRAVVNHSQYTIPAHSHYNHPPATLTSPHFHTTSTPVPPGTIRPPASHFHTPSPLTEQLRQVLADRERHAYGTPTQQSSQEDLLPTHPPRRVIPEHWQGKKSDESSGNTSISSTMSNPRVDTKQTPVPEKWMNLSPTEWSNEQVCQYLLFMNMEHLIPPFMDHGITGVQLLQIESRDLKAFGVNGEDKLKMKKKVKELKAQVEKEKKQIEKQKKELEKLQKKTVKHKK